MGVEDGPAAALVGLLLQTLGGGFAQRQVWFGAGLDVGRVRSVHGLVEGLGDGRAAAGLQREHAQESGLDVAVSGPGRRACCRACRRYNRVAIDLSGGGGGGAGEDHQQQPSAASSLFSGRGGALWWCSSGLAVVVTREHVRCTTAQNTTITARLHAWTVQVFAKARGREF